MFKFLLFIRKYYVALILVWMILFAADLVYILEVTYQTRPANEILFVLLVTFFRFAIVMLIWLAAQGTSEKKE